MRNKFLSIKKDQVAFRWCDTLFVKFSNKCFCSFIWCVIKKHEKNMSCIESLSFFFLHFSLVHQFALLLLLLSSSPIQWCACHCDTYVYCSETHRRYNCVFAHTHSHTRARTHGRIHTLLRTYNCTTTSIVKCHLVRIRWKNLNLFTIDKKMSAYARKIDVC